MKKTKSAKGKQSVNLHGIENQPVSQIQWVDREKLHANDYNPNHVAKPEFELIRESLRQDGWTLPLVVRDDYEIVDGFHRWTISGEKEFYDMTDGMVPVVLLSHLGKDRAHQIESTIRYNRARGIHAVQPMADIVNQLLVLGRSPQDISKFLGMEDEEVIRFQKYGRMVEFGSKENFNKAWKPNKKKEKDVEFMTDDTWDDRT